MIHDLIQDRSKTHGDFSDGARVMQNLKAMAKDSPNWDKLTSVQLEAIEMILHKLGRILAGDHFHRDHWSDIEGYARLAADRIDEGQQGG